MPLFTTKPTDQLFERFMKHHVSPAGSVGAERCPPGTSARITNQTPQKQTAFRPNWTQKKKGRKHTS